MRLPTNYHAGWMLYCTLLLASSVAVAADSTQTKQSNTEAVSPSAKSEDAGILQLKRGYPDLAKSTCEMTLKSDPKNEQARKCLDEALAELERREAGAQERTLAQAQSLLNLGKKTEALAAVEKIQAQIHRPNLAEEALEIVKKAGKQSLLDHVRQPLSEAGIAWILDVVIGAALIAFSYWTLKALRYLSRSRKALKVRSLGLRTRWRVTAVEDRTLVGTSYFVLSAYDSLKSHLSDSSNPIMLLVPPFGGTVSRRCVFIRQVKSGLSNVQASNTQRVAHPDGFLELKQQNFEFLDAVKELGVKVGGADLAGVGKFIAGIGKWFNAGVPTLTGLAFVDGTNVVVSLTCCDAKRYATVSSKGSDATVAGAQEAAEAAVYKMLYFLGHEGSTTRDADAAADLRNQTRELQKYLSGELVDQEGLTAVCNGLAETRRQIAMSPTAPEYLVDRARMWEAAARFLRNDAGDLERAQDLLERLQGSKGRAGLMHDIYNLAVVCQLLGREKLKSAHNYLHNLDLITVAWENLVVFEKVNLLADADYRKVWGDNAEDVRDWKSELVKFASAPAQPSNDEFIYELNRVRPADAVIWKAILSAELDCPEPKRPTDPDGIADRTPTLQAAKLFFKSQLSAASGTLDDTYLQLARVHLYLGEFKDAREFAAQYKNSSKENGAVAAYVEAEATYRDLSLNPTSRIVMTRDLIQPFAIDQYTPLQALKNAIATDLAKPPE